LHDAHSQNPLAPYNKTIIKEDLSPYSTFILENVEGKNTYKSKKMVSSFEKRVDYICHYENLQLYLQHGMILESVRRVLSFDQKPFIKEYVEYFTKLRSMSTTVFDNNNLKKIINSLYGKFLENTRNRLKIDLCSDAEKLQKLAASPLFISRKVVDGDLVAVCTKNPIAKMDKPYIIGTCILEKSKRIMYKTFYETILPHFGSDNLEIGTSDTDSYLFQSYSKNMNEDFKQLKDCFDFSNLPKSHDLYDETKKSALYHFKDETKRKVDIVDAICLRSKCYSLQTTGEGTKRIKGIGKAAVLNHVTHDHFTKCLHNCEIHKVNVNMIRTINHKLSSFKILKMALCPFDSKRYILNCGVHSIPFGHYSIKAKKGWCGQCYEQMLL
jgi:hypothetical protein